MFNKKNSEKIDYKNLNEILRLGKTILKILLITIIVVGVYVILMVLKELQVSKFLISILSILSPLFMGFAIAWLFNPFVKMLERKGIRRIIGVIISYEIIVLALVLIFSALIPVVYEQIVDFTNSVPAIMESIKGFIDSMFNKLHNMGSINTDMIKDTLYSNIANVGTTVTKTLPSTLWNSLLSIVSGIGNCLVGLIIGFFLLLGFDNIINKFYELLPNKFHDSTKELLPRINKSLRGYVNGAMFDASIIFVACSIVFALIGLKAPLLFALFCAIMNVIPYAGPYIGAVPALIVGFSQGTGIGIGVGISIIVIQMLEGNILSPIVMSKTTNLKPVTIIVGLLIFGHLFGMIGMLLSTPIIGILKVIFEFINKKYNLISGEKNEEF